MVTSLDWAPNTNRIVSCSQDKNAYVWTFDSSTNKWGPTLVHLRVDRAAIQVRWSPNEQKFAVASGSSSVAICYFGEDNNWWVSKHLKKSIASSVLSISWHPNSVLIVCGGADMVTRVFSTFIKGIDERPAPSVWGERLPFGTLCGEYESEYNGWIHSASFSPDGNQIAFVAHDSTLSIVDPVNNSIYSIQSPTVPHYQLSWVSPDKIIVSGQQPCPTACKLTSSGWEFSKETAKKGTGRPTTPRDRDSPLSRSSAFNIFRQMDSRASAVFSGDGAEEEHENGSAIS
ncbi:Actin-related protein 2/3 complex subunit 1 [Zancudomyces culisetae]|uniref:Arp2/3 complex 41 kDa subunit n=1 Tax=Zancudomyces culisetae TaxID=1213189 RepID=A0A1R1PVY6_ZANCU|nr:Actin-related protein 2/3 complex subunit 1 [Zancudomyces culisetae]|eukprot:OMH85073.1 Actin-related protein 2/3 complex subunit 1 [Zancudomyces culisetae]